MKIRFTPNALAEAKQLRTWWRANRPAVAALFEQELEAALERLGTEPKAGTLYEPEDFDRPVRRLLLEKTKNHVYYVVEAEEVVLLTVWGAPKGRAPKL